jgi:hypothetical protein
MLRQEICWQVSLDTDIAGDPMITLSTIEYTGELIYEPTADSRE